ncbi:MAG: DUF4159 domain-containing protein [Paracoccaceae bacterium]
MTVLGGIGFTAPWLLLGLLALPALWLILRAVPPAPIRRRFPGVALLLGLTDDESVSDRTPWWLLLLRMLAVAAVILGLAGPVLNPSQDRTGSGPLLFVLDSSWAGATRWPAKMDVIEAQLTEAGRAGRTVAMIHLTAPEPLVFQSADVWAARMAGLKPKPWTPDARLISQTVDLLGNDSFETYWMSDGLTYEGQDELLAALEERGPVRVYQSANEVLALQPATFEDGAVQLTARRSAEGGAREVMLLAHGRDPAGNARILASVPAVFDTGMQEAQVALSLPSELRARLTKFEIQGQRSAGAVSLSDDSLRRREVALMSGREDREGLELLSPLHYLEQALVPTADLINGALMDFLPANPDVIAMADVATLSAAEEAALLEWVESGGMLLRFAGPKLAASDVSRADEHPLMPVRLRAGGRTVGGAMSWGEPKALAPFSETSPFFGLQIPEDVRVTAQVLAQPDASLASSVIAELQDGTPLVTQKSLGDGQIVLFHVTANAEWSTLPLSGLFVEMLERLAVSSSAKTPSATELEGTTWTPIQILDGFGGLSDAGNLPGIEGLDLAEAPVGPNLQPGLYASGDRRIARNVVGADTVLTPASWPARIPVVGMTVQAELPVGGILLGAAIALLLFDVIASLALSGRLLGARAAAALLAILFLPFGTIPADAQSDDDFALAATDELVLGHVITGNRAVDDAARSGLVGLSEVLSQRTSVEPATPASINLEADELAFFPFLYWPITPDQPTPSGDAYAKLNEYLRSGGMILFDTRDADIARFGAASPNGRKLQDLARQLIIPPLEPLPSDHVLTRTFYLLQDFPGRHTSREVWVEAAPPNAEQIEGMPFRNLNDGVTPVVIGGNDWAAAWAMNDRGGPAFPIGRGFSGERQRELAYRFGMNLIMHVLTGNYKSDQVHVPALLDRLGQ